MTLTVALLCPGPSLPTYPGRAGIDSVIAVNRAAEAYAADYWVFGDAALATITTPLGRPIIVCDRGTLGRLRHTPLGGHAYIDRESAGPIAGHPIRWRHFSSTSALVLAFGIGATTIHCWGVDRVGVEDWDGVVPPQACRTEARWQREATIWSQLVDLLDAAGVHVVLHNDGETS